MTKISDSKNKDKIKNNHIRILLERRRKAIAKRKFLLKSFGPEAVIQYYNQKIWAIERDLKCVGWVNKYDKE